MIGHLRVKSPLSQLGIFLGLFGGAFILASLIVVAVATVKGVPVASIQNLDPARPGSLTTMKWIQSISSLVIFLLPALFFAIIVFNGRPLYFLGIRKPARINMYALAVVIVVAAFPFVLWLGEINQRIPLPEWITAMDKDASKHMEAFLKTENASDVAINILVIALLPAICEELCFRGALQRALINIVKNPWAGITLTAILFSALHLQFQGFLPRMFLGMALGALYWYSGSLWTSILAHFVVNATQIIAVSYAPKYINENPSVPVYLTIGSAVVVLALMAIYRRESPITYSKWYKTEELNKYNQFIS